MHCPPPHISSVRRSIVLLLAVAVAAAYACGDDDMNDVAGQCAAACDEIAEGCAVPTPRAEDCSAACAFAGGLAPGCTDRYASVIACARDRPLLACQDETVSVTLSG